MKEEFILFLKRKRILTKFKDNLKRQNSMGRTLDTFWGQWEDEFPEDVLSINFTWDNTPEGYEFWKNIEIDWEEYLSTGKTNK